MTSQKYLLADMKDNAKHIIGVRRFINSRETKVQNKFVVDGSLLIAVGFSFILSLNIA